MRVPSTGETVRAGGPIISGSGFGTPTVVDKKMVVTAGVTGGYYGTTGVRSFGNKQSFGPWVDPTL